jgi:hypothetical protein
MPANERPTDAVTRPVLKIFSIVVVSVSAPTAPATVHSIPHWSTRAYVARRLPTRVATPFDTSFAPFAHATAAAHRIVRSGSSIMTTTPCFDATTPAASSPMASMLGLAPALADHGFWTDPACAPRVSSRVSVDPPNT